MKFVFADTGHEHPITYEYVEYLSEVLKQYCGVGIDWIHADFTQRIINKQRYVYENWAHNGVPPEHIEQAIKTLVPTGNPFLDLCLWKGRFPSTKARFCTQELKHVPLSEYTDSFPGTTVSWQGVRADESHARKDLPMYDVEMGSWEPKPTGKLIYRPIIHWTAADCFTQHKRFGVKHNPLYEMGMGRVGCMPCIHARKGELRNIALRFPEEIDRVREWEALVCKVSKRGTSTLMTMGVNHPDAVPGEPYNVTHGIDRMVSWASTLRGGVVQDPEYSKEAEAPLTCSSIYGLCE